MENEALNNALSPVTPAKSRPWSPWARLGLLVIFIGTLPFTWGETSSCNGPTRTYTGLEQATKPGNLIPFVIIFATPVVLGFLQYLARAAWVRLGTELLAAMFACLGTVHCLASAVFGGGLLGSHSTSYPAPWVATITMTLTSLDTFGGVLQQLHALFWGRRNAAKTEPQPPEAPPNTGAAGTP